MASYKQSTYCKNSDNPMIVFIVDDNEMDLALTKQILKNVDAIENIIKIDNAERFLEDVIFGEYYNQLEDANIVILLDLNMPGVDGFSILQGLKGHPLTERIPVILLTGDDRGKSAQECYEMKANGYLSKPIDERRFLGAVQSGWATA